MADSVIIQINGDIKDYTAKLESVQKQTEDLSKALNKTGIVSAAAFAIVTAGAVKAVNAFKDSIKPGVELQNILKNQGIYSEKLVGEYNQIAKELKKITGVDDELITSGQAVIQRFLGQTKVTKELTQAILDFAAGTGVDTVTAFNLVGKSIGTGTNALAKYGFEIDANLTAQEKMQVFIANTNAKFRDQAKVVNESTGPLGRLSNAFGNVVEKIGEKLAPTIDGIAGSLEDLADAASESDAAGDAIASLAVAIGGLAGGGIILSQVATGIVAITTAAKTLEVSVALLSGVGAAIAGITAAYLAFDSYTKRSAIAEQAKSVAEAQEKIIVNEKRILELRKLKAQNISVDPELQNLEMKNLRLKKQIDQFNQLAKAEETKKKQVAVDQEALKAANELNKAGEKRKKAADEDLKSIEDKKKAVEDLKKSLIDAGKTEYDTLVSLRDRRIEIAQSDADARLLIEKDFNEKKSELFKKQIQEESDLRDKEEEQRKKKLDETKSVNSQIGGALSQIGNGREGARNLIVEGAAKGIDSFAPGFGDALKPLIGSLSQGPEATKAFIKEFVDGVPEIIGALAEAIPVFVEEFANAVPVITDKLIEKIPDIVGAFVRATPKIIEAQVKQAPRIIESMIERVPKLIESFVDGLFRGAGDFVQALIDAINPFSGEGDGNFVSNAVSDVGDFLGFANGGSASVKGVPSGFSGDRFPAFLSSDELVVKPKVARDLEAFLDSQASGGGNLSTGLLQQILTALQAPMTVSTSIDMNATKLANAILQLNRSNARLL